MRVAVLGGDGFCGWPTSLRLAARGHDVLIIDDLSRRAIDRDLDVQSLTPITGPSKRVEAWNSKFGDMPMIRFVKLDIASSYNCLCEELRRFGPDAVVHFAEQRSAPFSMKLPRTKRYTVDNNIGATNNLLCALVELRLDAHLVHLGTMGVYGYSGGERIPEGYLKVATRTGQREILHPSDPGSIYHMTKVMDQALFAFYAKNDGLRITDLHQGIVWGTQTDETMRAPELINRFDYDGDYGTVLNRFVVQAVCGQPLTVHGTGGQSRGFIHIGDSVQCIVAALRDPPQCGGPVRIVNQITEVHNVLQLATMVSILTGAPIAFVDNPRKEAASNDLAADNDAVRGWLDRGPVRVTAEQLDQTRVLAKRHAGRIDIGRIAATVRWTRGSVRPAAVA